MMNTDLNDALDAFRAAAAANPIPRFVEQHELTLSMLAYIVAFVAFGVLMWRQRRLMSLSTIGEIILLTIGAATVVVLGLGGVGATRSGAEVKAADAVMAEVSDALTEAYDVTAVRSGAHDKHGTGNAYVATALAKAGGAKVTVDVLLADGRSVDYELTRTATGGLVLAGGDPFEGEPTADELLRADQ